ncbi:ATP-binding protein [Streptomyces sp. A0592]|uniref:ATP-binding protein n=1 Tax=Streptomyces sp. A0592 TaxID=2563099 RepID=UPI00109E68F3|nr:ATP-binding protein [Streptomyces sp. A0592]THA81230.1 ATP-binding protein [Streptomyces sp. A0592]
MDDRSRLFPAPVTGDVSCAQARETARLFLDELEPALLPERREDVLTVVSELISNARRHAGGVTHFDIRVHLGALVVEVSDRSPRGPLTRPWAPGQPGGFGWRLVKQLADRAHVYFHEGAKTVSATFFTGVSEPRRPSAS